MTANLPLEEGDAGHFARNQNSVHQGAHVILPPRHVPSLVTRTVRNQQVRGKTCGRRQCVSWPATVRAVVEFRENLVSRHGIEP
jgi:hypothetical protein